MSQQCFKWLPEDNFNTRQESLWLPNLTYWAICTLCKPKKNLKRPCWMAALMKSLASYSSPAALWNLDIEFRWSILNNQRLSTIGDSALTSQHPNIEPAGNWWYYNVCHTCPRFCPSLGPSQYFPQYARQTRIGACVANIVISAIASLVYQHCSNCSCNLGQRVQIVQTGGSALNSLYLVLAMPGIWGWHGSNLLVPMNVIVQTDVRS